MPHYKCEVCRTRLYSTGSPAELDGDLCPDCGSLLELVENASDVLGFRSIEWRADSSDPEATVTDEPVAEPVDVFRDRRVAILAQAQFEAEQWLDDGGSFAAEAVALPRPEASS
jgi:hypothetical protein